MPKKNITTPAKTSPTQAVDAPKEVSQPVPEETYNLLARLADLEVAMEGAESSLRHASSSVQDARLRVNELEDQVEKLDEFRKDILKSKDLDFKQKMVIGGIYLAGAALSIYGIVKLGRMPKTPPANLFIGELRDDAAATVLGEFTKAAKASGAKVVMDVKHSLN